MSRQCVVSLLLLAASVAHAQEQAGEPPPAEPAPASEQPPAAPNTPAPETPAAAPSAPAPASAAAPAQHRALTPAEERALVEGRQQLLHDRRFHDEPAVPAERHATDAEARSHFSIALSLDSLFNDDPGYDLFDDDDVSSRLGLWVSYDVAQLAPRTVLAIEIGAGFESQEQGVWEGALESELDSQTFSAGASLRYDLLSWLAPQLRAAGGLSLFAFQLKTDDANFEDHAVSGFGSLGAGVLLHTPERLFENKQGGFASVQIGFLIEAGYALRSPVEFELERETSALAIPVADASLGELALAGPYIRSSLLVRF